MFIAYEVSLQLLESLRPLVSVIERSDRDLADQMRRAASSILLNLAEGQRLTKGNKQKQYVIAHGSANEVKASLQAAVAWGWLEDASGPLRVLEHLLRLLWGLTHSRKI